MGPWNLPKHVIRKRKKPAFSKEGQTNSQNENNTSVTKHNVQAKEGRMPMVTYKEGEVESSNQHIVVDNSNQSVIDVNQVTKAKVKNPMGGKNPQLSVKGKKVTKNSKAMHRKDKCVVLGNIPKASIKNTKKSTSHETRKEIMPSSSNMNNAKQIQAKEEQAVLDYMKTMYKTHGENLLNKFKNMESVRTTLEQVDNNDRSRGDTSNIPISPNRSPSKSKSAQSSRNTSNERCVQVDQGVSSPMVMVEDLIPSNPNLSL